MIVVWYGVPVKGVVFKSCCEWSLVLRRGRGCRGRGRGGGGGEGWEIIALTIYSLRSLCQHYWQGGGLDVCVAGVLVRTKMVYVDSQSTPHPYPPSAGNREGGGNFVFRLFSTILRLGRA